MSEGSEASEHDVVTARLLRLYRRYLGEPDQLSDVYVGFGLFFGGVALAAVGVALFLWSSTLPDGSGPFWVLREIAISLAMLGLPAFLLGVVVLLPADRRALVGGTVGAAVCLLAVGLFVANYPANWNAPGADASATGVTVYALGVVLATAAVGAALVSNYIARAEPGGAPATAAGGDGSSTIQAETVTDEQVRADIDAAMSGTELSWGGVERDDTKRLTITTDEADIDRSGFDAGSATERRDSARDVDTAVSGLQKLRGGDVDQAAGEGVDQQTDALRQLRERQAADAASADDGILTRLRERFGR